MGKDIEILEDMRDNIYGAMQFEDDYQVTELEEKQFNALNLAIKSINRVKELEKENREIRDWKYVIDSYEDLDKLKELDLIKIKGKEYISKSKIKEKIKGLRDVIQYSANPLAIDNSKYAIDILQELLEEEK